MKNHLLIGIVTALLAGAVLFNYQNTNTNKLVEFESFKSTYGKIYPLEENIYRFSIFVKNLEKIARHNADSTQTYTLGVNQFADLTAE